MGRRRLALVYGTALVVLVLDQLTKWLVVERLAGGAPVRIVGSFVQLRYTTNPGGAFSLLTGFPLFFGEVVDFVDVGSFPVFNLADSCISVGAVALAVLLTMAEREHAGERGHPEGRSGDAERAGR
jgi:signal peptidase II